MRTKERMAKDAGCSVCWAGGTEAGWASRELATTVKTEQSCCEGSLCHFAPWGVPGRSNPITQPNTLPTVNLIQGAALPIPHQHGGWLCYSCVESSPRFPADCPAEDTGCMYKGLTGLLANCAKSILGSRASFPTTPHIARQGLTTLILKSLPKDRRLGVVVSTGLEGDRPTGFRSCP